MKNVEIKWQKGFLEKISLERLLWKQTVMFLVKVKHLNHNMEEKSLVIQWTKTIKSVYLFSIFLKFLILKFRI